MDIGAPPHRIGRHRKAATVRPAAAFPGVRALFVQASAGDALKAVHEDGDSCLGRILDRGRGAWSSSPSCPIGCAPKPAKTLPAMAQSRAWALPSKTLRRSFATKTEWTFILKHSSKSIMELCDDFRPSNTNGCQTGGTRRLCARHGKPRAARLGSAPTGRKRKFVSGASTPVSAKPATTFCARPQPRSARTTRWCVSGTCRCGLWPGRRQVRSNNRARKSRPGLTSTSLSSARAGLSSAANWITRLRAMAGISSPRRPRTRAGHARCAATCRPATGGRKPGSSTWDVVSGKTPIWSARSTFSERDTPVAPVECAMQ